MNRLHSYTQSIISVAPLRHVQSDLSHHLLLCAQVSDLSWLSGTVKVPFLLVPKVTKGKFHMAPPASVDLIGSYPLGTCVKPRIKVDLAATIPAVSHPLKPQCWFDPDLIIDVE